MLRLLRAGDTLVITRLDRLGRSVLHLVTLGAQLRERGIGLRVVEQGIDTATVEGRAMFRDVVSTRRAAARADRGQHPRRAWPPPARRGRNGGRRPKLTPAQAGHAQQLYDAGEHTVAQIAALLGVARTTVYGHLNRAAAEPGAGPVARIGSSS